ncbi:hypothetical protein [Vampirovibrio chlorellavorus]|uniref:hypothetical protein n=1 Tax=Vampirovibrio chlorellavorus TaxID=758823 RepID=UPI0026EF7670|nr:hypothetical protein [Vampirovibrio chlorellavorus]
MHNVDKSSNFKYKYSKLPLRLRRLTDEAVEIIREHPTDFKNRITHISNRKEGALYRFRQPGCYLIYIVPEPEVEGEAVTIIMMDLKAL